MAIRGWEQRQRNMRIGVTDGDEGVGAETEEYEDRGY